MNNTYAVFVSGDEYTCTDFFDTDNGSGIDVKNAMTQEHIGEIFGEVVPDVDADSDEIERFETIVIEFVEENI